MSSASPLLTATAILVVATTTATTARASEGHASFALVIGTNASVDEDLAPLRYADDDAARSFDLFRALGARTYLLSRLDDDTARLHPQAAAEALDPVDARLGETVKALAGNVAVARARGLETTLYVVYAGHGNVDGSRGYITLEDARLYGDDLIDRVVDGVNAGQTHLIVDACYSYFLAYGRGPGGARREVSDFSRLVALADEGRVGLILSTSSAAESHEWEAFQAGVFSHEIRSGLYGAADANGDGVVSYREISAFVDKANVAIPNERFRPKLHAKAPKGSDALVDLARSRSGSYIELDGQRSGHYMLETELGVRLVDFHNAPGQPIRVLRDEETRLFLRDVEADVEYELEPSSRDVRVAGLSPQPVRVQGRGAAHHSFSLLFQEPFSMTDVVRYAAADTDAASAGWPWATVVGGATVALAAVVAAGAVVAGGGAMALMLSVPAGASQAEVAATNQLILVADGAAVALAVGALGLGALGAAAYFLLPDGAE